VAIRPTRPLRRGRGREARLRANDPHHRHPPLELLLERRQRSGGGRVACHDEQLDAPPEQDGGRLAREPEKLLGRAIAVRKAGGVAQAEKSSCGSDTRHSCRTVSAPTPESKTATGRERSGVAMAAYGRGRRGARAALSTGTCVRSRVEWTCLRPPSGRGARRGRSGPPPWVEGAGRPRAGRWCDPPTWRRSRRVPAASRRLSPLSHVPRVGRPACCRCSEPLGDDPRPHSEPPEVLHGAAPLAGTGLILAPGRLQLADLEGHLGQVRTDLLRELYGAGLASVEGGQNSLAGAGGKAPAMTRSGGRLAIQSGDSRGGRAQATDSRHGGRPTEAGLSFLHCAELAGGLTSGR
jgi:hypothetical protein